MWTWDQLTEYATKLVRRVDNDVKVYGVSTPVDVEFNTSDFFGSALWSFGGDWADRATEAIAFHKPEGVAALDAWVNLSYKLRVAPMSEPADWKELPGDKEVTAFSSGLSAVAYCFSTNIRGYQQANPSFKWTTVHMPRKTKGGSHFFAFGWYIPQGAKQRDGATEFIRLASLPEHIAPWNIASYGMVTRKSAAEQSSWRDHLRSQPLLAPFSDALSYARTYPSIAGWQDVLVGEGGLAQMVAKARMGEVTPPQALEEAARVGAAALERAKAGT
jgi:ABC-type glycerol-3-phosphate transport system substrate-binding protein